MYSPTRRQRFLVLSNEYCLIQCHSLHLMKQILTESTFCIYTVLGSSRGVQPTAHGPHEAQDGYECGPTQNCKFIENLSFCSSVFISVCVFNVWPKTTLLLPVWLRDAKRLDTLLDGKRCKARAIKQRSYLKKKTGNVVEKKTYVHP